jgi:Flp pilus assembly protein TadB
MASALRALAVDLQDPAADVLVCSLTLAATSQTQRLTDVLGALAESIRDDVAMRLRVHASRASARSSVRTIVLFSLGFVGALMVVARSYLQPFGTLSGQVVLLAIGLCYGGGLLLMLWLVRTPPSIPLLDLGQL